MFGEQGLVRRDDVLTGGQRRRDVLERGIRTSHGLDDDIDFGIFDEAADLGRHTDVVEANAAGLLRIADGDPFPADRPAGAMLQTIGMLGQELRHAGPYRTQADQANRDVFHVSPGFLAIIPGSGTTTSLARSRVRFAARGVQPDINPR